MAMRLKYQTERDTSLEHQVVIYMNRDTGSDAIMVTCNCNKLPNEGRPGNTKYVAMGVVKTLADTKALYNDPYNHYAPFDEEKWGLKW